MMKTILGDSDTKVAGTLTSENKLMILSKRHENFVFLGKLNSVKRGFTY